MSEHLLHLPDRSPSFEQMGCERVAEGVGADAFFDSGIPRSLFEDGEDHDAREVAPAVVQEESILAGTGFGAFVEVAVDAFAGRGADGHEPLFVAFSDDADVALAEEEILDFQGYELRDAQSAGVEEFEHGAVAQTLDGGGVDGGDDAVDLVGREDVGELASEFGGQDELRGRIFDLVGDHQEVEEALDAAQRTGLRGLLASAVEKPGHVSFDHLWFDLLRGDVPHAEDEVCEGSQVAHVGLDGVLCETFFEFDVGAVATCRSLPFFRIFGHSGRRIIGEIS